MHTDRDHSLHFQQRTAIHTAKQTPGVSIASTKARCAPARWDRSAGTASLFGTGGSTADEVDQDDRREAATPASPRSTAAELQLTRSSSSCAAVPEYCWCWCCTDKDDDPVVGAATCCLAANGSSASRSLSSLSEDLLLLVLLLPPPPRRRGYSELSYLPSWKPCRWRYPWLPFASVLPVRTGLSPAVRNGSGDSRRAPGRSITLRGQECRAPLRFRVYTEKPLWWKGIAVRLPSTRSSVTARAAAAVVSCRSGQRLTVEGCTRGPAVSVFFKYHPEDIVSVHSVSVCYSARLQSLCSVPVLWRTRARGKTILIPLGVRT